MLKSKVSIFVLVGVLLAIAIGLQFINRQENDNPEGIKAIPLDASIILETSNLPELIKKANNNKFTDEFSSITAWENFFNQLEFLDTLFDKNREIRNIFSSGKLICSGHLMGKNVMQFVYILPLKSSSDEDILRNFIAGFTMGTDGLERAKIMQRSYEGYYVYNMFYFDEKDKDLSFNYTFADGLFIFSFSKILFEESVRMLNTTENLSTDKAFTKIKQIAGKNVDANLFINYKYFPNSLTNLIAPSNSKFYDFASEFASWSVLDIKLKNDALLMSGFTYSNDSLNNYLNIFKGQDNLEHEFLEILPENTAAFLAINLSDITSFSEKYVQYRKKNRNYQKTKIKLDRLKKIYRYNFADDFYDYIEGTVSLIYLPDKIISNKPLTFGIFQINDAEQLSELLKEQARTRLQKDTAIHINENLPAVIDAKENITANIFPAPELFSLLFGQIFSDLDAQYYIFLNDYLVTAKSIKDLKYYYQKYKSGLLIQQNKNFVDFSNTLSSESNIFLYLDFFYGKTLITPKLSNKFKRTYTKNSGSFDKLQASALQFGVEKDMFFTGFSLKYNPGYNEAPKNIWQIKLEAPLEMEPQFVVNHYTKNKEVLIQDSLNNLILYSTDGKLLWKRSLPGKILGKVHQIDFYRNNKLQLLFNTREYIFLIDRKGRDVENFPVKFKSPATNGLAVFDYENKKNYRIFVACENQHVYLLDKNATKVSGWEFDKTQSKVSMPVKHFVSQGKDYLVFADEENIYILNRRGKTRVHLQAQFEKSKNAEIYFDRIKGPETATFITTGKDGIVYFIFLDGSVKKMTLGKFSSDHYFKYGELLGNGEKYFVFADNNKLSVFKGDKSPVFEKEFNDAIGSSLNLHQAGKVQLIGCSDNSVNQIYLFSPKGKLIKGIPMEGSGLFGVDKLNTKSDIINVITGSNENILYNYSLK